MNNFYFYMVTNYNNITGTLVALGVSTLIITVGCIFITLMWSIESEKLQRAPMRVSISFLLVTAIFGIMGGLLPSRLYFISNISPQQLTLICQMGNPTNNFRMTEYCITKRVCDDERAY